MSGTNNQDILVGIELIGETLKEETSQNLGALLVKDVGNLRDLRKLLCAKIPSIPSDFVFLTKKGWPVLQDEENSIIMSHVLSDDLVIKIQRYFDKPRVGIRVWRQDIIGFAFVDMTWKVTQLRHSLQKQVNEKNAEIYSDFTFLDKNGWPINSYQEDCLTVWDLITSNYITLRLDTVGFPAIHHGHEILKKKRKLTVPTHENRIQKQTSVCTDGSFNSFAAEEESSPSVIISYVRAEAEKHARDLKWKLMEIGFKVFLDVDEIRGGLDWQDELNAAVQNCGVFVPLITSQYGLTLWSNREVKLADQMSKFILPVNFMDAWPPECLAIQFSSLQYIPWKTHEEMETALQEGEADRAKDIRFWDAMYVKRVAEDILNCYQSVTDVKNVETQSKGSELKPTLKMAQHTTFVTRTGPMRSDSTGTKMFFPVKPVVAISVHPKQKDLAEQIRKYLFTNGLEIWCSTDLLDHVGMDTSEERLTSATSPITPGHSDGSCDSYNIFNHLNKRQLSTESTVLHASLSDLSQMSLSPDVLNKLNVFREQVKKADIVIVMVSKAYCKSKTSQKQVYYCEHRKKVIIVQVENFQLPCWLTVLLGNDTLEYSECPTFYDELKKRIDSACDPAASSKVCYKELQLLTQITKLEKHVDKRSCIYICGSSKFYYPKSESICHSLGQELAEISSLSIATAGFYGVGEAVGRSFCEEREINGEKPAKVYHILPERDNADFSQEARQNHDGTFLKIPYGQTVFVGKSVREREDLVTRVFSICILIEGGPKEARVAEEFVWNDNIVIPIMSTGGAASGEHGVPSHIMEIPGGVLEHDWVTLAKRDVTADEIARAVKRIVCCLLGRKNSSLLHKKKPKKH